MACLGLFPIAGIAWLILWAVHASDDPSLGKARAPKVEETLDLAAPLLPETRIPIAPFEAPVYAPIKQFDFKPVKLMPKPAVTRVKSDYPLARYSPYRASEPDLSATRPTSGTTISDNSDPLAKGTFEASNHSGLDAAVYVTPVGTHAATLSFYVRDGEESTVSGIPDGTYEVFVRTGSNWHESSMSFIKDEALKEFEDTFTYTTQDDGVNIHTCKWMVTLHPVIGGTAKTKPVALQTSHQLIVSYINESGARIGCPGT